MPEAKERYCGKKIMEKPSSIYLELSFKAKKSQRRKGRKRRQSLTHIMLEEVRAWKN
jgi:hypothetical protein